MVRALVFLAGTGGRSLRPVGTVAVRLIHAMPSVFTVARLVIDVRIAVSFAQGILHRGKPDDGTGTAGGIGIPGIRADDGRIPGDARRDGVVGCYGNIPCRITGTPDNAAENTLTADGCRAPQLMEPME